MTSELETSFVAVERTKEYAETPTEAPAIVESRRPPPEWPSEGHIKFDQYYTRYREGLGYVLRNISVEVPGGTKVKHWFRLINHLVGQQAYNNATVYYLLILGRYCWSNWSWQVITHPGSVPDH